MKKFFIWVCLGLFGLTGTVALAQSSPKHPRPHRFTVNFESHHGEAFTVFVDGNIMNRMPQNRVMVNDLSDRPHEVVVVLRRPAQKAAVLHLLANEPTVLVNVNYEARTDELMLYTPSYNLVNEQEQHHPPVVAHTGAEPPAPVHTQEQPHHNPAYHTPAEVHHASEADVNAMVARMRKQTFDSDRLALGKVIVASSNLTAGQIARLAETIDFSSSQVDFLKYAYHYCVDKMNYSLAINVLTFSTDKKKVMDYIATQK